MKTTLEMYCQYLLSSQTNYTCTNLSESVDKLDENSVYRFLQNNKLTPKLVRDKAKENVIWSENGYLLFDDTVLDKNHSFKIDGVKLQYSGNAHKLIKGIALISCIYYNPEEDKFWLIDYRIYDPEVDGLDKLEHMEDMLNHNFNPYSTVLMDMMKLIIKLGKIFYCPIKSNRMVDDTNGAEKYKNVSELTWSKDELNQGKLIKIKKAPADFKVKLFKVVSNKNIEDVEFVVTNDITQDSTNGRLRPSLDGRLSNFTEKLSKIQELKLVNAEREEVREIILPALC